MKEKVENAALQMFCDMMIERISTIRDDWKKPWFTEGATTWPKNLSGREYNGMNALMLMIHCENKGYKVPVFLTFDRVNGLNFEGGTKTGHDKLKDMPIVSVNKGEKSFPVFITTFTVINEKGEKMLYSDYKEKDEEYRNKCKVFPKLNVYNVFNIAQTNIEKARPELYKKILEQNAPVKREVKEGEGFSFPEIDWMIDNDGWICPIKPTYGDDAYYSISKAHIVVPEKKQFKNDESFYANLSHEMAHSTGSEGYLNRLKVSTFGSKEYAREELVAELSAALISQRYGMEKCIKEDSIPYLKHWLDSLKESPEFIKTVLVDVKKAVSLIVDKIEKASVEISKSEVA